MADNTHNLLSDIHVVGNVVGKAGLESDGVGIDIEARLDEGQGGVLQITLVTSGQRVINAIHTEGLSSGRISTPGLRYREYVNMDITSSEDLGWKLSTTGPGRVS